MRQIPDDQYEMLMALVESSRKWRDSRDGFALAILLDPSPHKSNRPTEMANQALFDAIQRYDAAVEVRSERVDKALRWATTAPAIIPRP